MDLKLVIVGHVDHGKSSLIGRLLADTGSLCNGELERIKHLCAEKGKEFEYAFVLDALQEEREQGITIDTTKIEFSAKNRNYIIIDAPGHKEFLKNMVTGASHAEAAILIIDVSEGLREQTKRHAFLLSLLGISQVIVAVNKMDEVDYSEEMFDKIVEEVNAYLRKLNIIPIAYIPISAKKGDNVASPTRNMPWYSGQCVLDTIEMFKNEKPLDNNYLRFPIQDVYKFDDRRIIAGRIESGTMKIGDEISVYPSGKIMRVKTIESWPDSSVSSVSAGKCIGITVSDDYFLKRGEVICSGTSPSASNFFLCTIFWMGHNPLVIDKTYQLKLNTQETDCRVHSINKVIDANTLEESSKMSLSRHEVGEVVIRTKEPIVFDSFEDCSSTGRFVVVDEYVVCGGGTILRSADVLKSRSAVKPRLNFISPKKSIVSASDRHIRNGHKGKVVWITGLPGAGKKEIAQSIEKQLFDAGKQAYHIDAATVRLSLSSDLTFSEESRHEQARRIAEVANLFCQAGFIVIVSIVSPYRANRVQARDIIGKENFIEIFVDAPIELCKERDPHGIYSRADMGEISDVPGFHFQYEHSNYLVRTLSIREKDFDAHEKAKMIMLELNESV